MWHFQPPTPISKYKQHKENQPWILPEALVPLQEEGLGVGGWVEAGMDVTQSSHKTIHTTLAQCHAEKPAYLRDLKCHRQDKSHHEASTGTNVRTAAGMPWRPRGALEPLLCSPAGAQQQCLRKEVHAAPDRVSLRLMQPQPDSGVSSIITPLSLWDLSWNEACFLPGAISFYPGWRLKADQWGQ